MPTLLPAQAFFASRFWNNGKFPQTTMSDEPEQLALRQQMDTLQAESRKYREWLGQIVSGFQTLELFLRIQIQMMPNVKEMGITAYQDMFAYPVGTELPETEMTSYDALGDILKKYNSEARKRSYPEIDPMLVDLRDALAHGKVGYNPTKTGLRLIKFSKRNAAGLVEVTWNVDITEDWCNVQLERLTRATALLVRFYRWT